MSRNKHESHPDPAQEELFPVDVERRGYGQPDVVTYGHPDNTVTAAHEAQTSEVTDQAEPFVIQDARLRLTALEELREASKLAGLVKGVKTGERDRIMATMEHPEGMVMGAKFKSGMNFIRAKKKILDAFNLTRETPVDEYDEEFKIAWAEFSQNYGLGNNPEETARKGRLRREEIQRLTTVIEAYAQEQTIQEQ